MKSPRQVHPGVCNRVLDFYGGRHVVFAVDTDDGFVMKGQEHFSTAVSFNLEFVKKGFQRCVLGVAVIVVLGLPFFQLLFQVADDLVACEASYGEHFFFLSFIFFENENQFFWVRQR